jgi:2-C-methyl-D-erythritol 4-phosphate cytidylyltransferase
LSKAKGDIIGVHDGVRPLISKDFLKLLVEEATQFQSAVPVLTLKESLRFVSKNKTHAVKRSEYVSVQTPQLFLKDIISKAYEIPFHEGITDDASLVEEAGFSIHLVQGEEQNIKITSALDLTLAEFYFSEEK